MKLIPYCCVQHKYLIYILLLNSLVMIEGALMNSESLLADFILANYSKQARPVMDLNYPVNVTFGIEIMHFIKLDDRNQMLTTKMMVRQSWRNMLMRWNSSEWKGVSSLQFDANLLWFPDIILYNNADVVFPGGAEKYQTKISVTENGFAYWYSPVTFTSTCSIDIKYFPFDEQRCLLKFGSWTLDIKGIDMQTDANPLYTKHYVNSSEWDLVSATQKRNVVKYTCCKHPYVDITFDIVLLRKPLYYVFNVILPCLVLITTILFGFFLPPESGERISLTITILLAVAVFLQLVTDALPRNSDSIPILAIFYMVIMAETAISLITTCVVLVIHYRNSDKGSPPMPEWVRKVFLVHCANILRVKWKSRSITIDGEENGQIQNHEIGSTKGPMRGFHGDHMYQSTFEHEALDDIMEQVHFIAETMEEKERERELQEEWKFLANVLDRLFFWLFLVTAITSASCILIPVYLIHH